MAEQPTGNIWNDPDTFALPASERRPANPANSLASAATGMKANQWNDPDTFGQPREERVVANGATAVLAAPKVVTEKELAAEDGEAVTILKAQIARVAKDAKAGQPDAQVLLREIVTAEYARPDGGRLPIKRALAAAGAKKPA